MLKSLFLDDRKILWPISLNALVLFALGFSQQLPPNVIRALNSTDDLITLIFVVEFLVKLKHLGWNRYIESHWNKFDFALLMLSLPSPTARLLNLHALDVHYLLAFRVCRVFKFFRFLRFVPGIDHMLEGIQRALRASVMMLFAFFIGLFMVSLLSTKLFGAVAPEHYGDPLRSLYSTFKIFTVEGWFEIPDEVTSHLSPTAAFFARIFFSGLVLGAGILGLSIINSIFVDAMVADNNDDLEAKIDAMREELRQLRAALLARDGRDGGSDETSNDA